MGKKQIHEEERKVVLGPYVQSIGAAEQLRGEWVTKLGKKGDSHLRPSFGKQGANLAGTRKLDVDGMIIMGQANGEKVKD